MEGLVFCIAFAVVFIALLLVATGVYLVLYADKIIEYIKEKYGKGKIPTNPRNKSIKDISQTKKW